MDGGEVELERELREQLEAVEEALRDLPGDGELEQYATEEPDFAALAGQYPALQPFVLQRRPGARPTIDFGDPRACAALTTALLAHDFGIRWSLPEGHLIPPLTGRSNYIHWLQDLLDLSSPKGQPIRGLDIGTGANLIYPLLGARLCGWAFVGSDVSRGALAAAAKLREANLELADRIELRHVPMQPEQLRFFDGEGGSDAVGGTHQTDCRDGALVPSADNDIQGVGTGILSGAIRNGDPLFAFSMCNPPFFESMEEAGLNPATGFGGTELEMVYPGGEAAFVLAMARDSTTVNRRVHWFTTMVGKKATLKSLRAALHTLGVRALRTTEFSQGRTSRWAVAWSWLVPEATAQALELPTTEARDLMSERLQAAITPDVCQSLSSMGWAVVDGTFGPRLCSALRSELVGISDRMQTNCTHLVVDANNNRKLLPKHNIWEAELRDKSIKAQRNTGGCFPVHTDSDVGVDGRAVTALVYLNPEWAPQDGGQLRLYPWPMPPVDVAPLNDRMVLFASKTLLHSAGPSPDAAWACLLHPSLRKHAARYALRDEWARSLEESHPPSAERDALLSNFWREIGVIERVVKPLFDATAGQPPPRQLTHSAWL
ncbi:hypothetical protein QBZ16_002565 [Prototheca wickerhamii]|uniref:Prolyl 4-hydroxylase alpha subunit Fe(2+) 2OG dioxygenase domain-containing protein n=1 Tax=Prototheca wickerhamii TaxID=3111 RepID=A0AAD9ILL3_PROWI|nr:hypothetical protein QBZ16_002565 [Prototheca wickerhamii]